MKNNNLRAYYPTIRTKKEVLTIINGDKRMRRKYIAFPKHIRREILDFCSGAKGMKVLYDTFFKEVLNPEYHPERLNDLLSEILGHKVIIKSVLPVDSTRLGDETSLVTMDIVAELETGELINIEMQKIGYDFPGQRSSCYSSDLLLRQYKRAKDSTPENAKFNYGNIKSVYVIVFFETSPKEFADFPDTYIHNFKQTSDSGLELELLQKYIFIPLDIFSKNIHNVDNKFNAWLTFLSSDKVEDIINLTERYPEFKAMYETIYNMCLNVEGVMNMFSKELYELDKATELYMIDRMQKELNEQRNALAMQRVALNEQRDALAEKDLVIKELQRQLQQVKS